MFYIPLVHSLAMIKSLLVVLRVCDTSLQQYVSAYNRGKQQSSSSNSVNYYCEVCDKHLNGPKPFQAHMVSKAHKEELALSNE